MRQQMLLTVTPLRRAGSEEIEATGFFFSFGEKTFLITCYHVVRHLKSASDEWTATVHLDGAPSAVSQASSSPPPPPQKSGSPSPPPSPVPRPSTSVLKERAGVITFRVPEDVIFCPKADLCAVEIQDKIAAQIEDRAIFRTIDPNRVAVEQNAFWTNFMDIGLAVFLPGYPKGLSDTHHHLPLVRSGTLAFDPSLGWNGDPSLGVVNMTVFKGDSGAPLFWQGQAFQVMEQQVVKGDSRSKKKGPHKMMQEYVAVPVNELRLVGVHCGGYDQKADKLDMGVYVKVAELAKGFSDWPRMDALKSAGYAHPYQSRSEHTLHASGGMFPLSSSGDKMAPSALDLGLLKRLGGGDSAGEEATFDLVEKRIGRYWTFAFDRDSKGILQTLSTSEQVFHRTDSEAVGGPVDHACLRFVGPQSASGTFDAIFLFRVYTKTRSDGVVVSGIYCADLNPHESYESSTQGGIAWVWKGS